MASMEYPDEGVVTTTVAARGASWRSASSPKALPLVAVDTLPTPSIRTSAEPEAMRRHGRNKFGRNLKVPGLFKWAHEHSHLFRQYRICLLGHLA
eukprot:scaffold140448_cov31-Tisochrysis_lutea.AAC.5